VACHELPAALSELVSDPASAGERLVKYVRRSNSEWTVVVTSARWRLQDFDLLETAKLPQALDSRPQHPPAYHALSRD